MSNTQRWIQFGWGPQNPEFREIHPNILTEKHLSKDRKSMRPKNHRFCPLVKNSRYNLQRKNEQIALKEHLSMIE